MKFDEQYWKELDTELSGWMSEDEARFLVENIVINKDDQDFYTGNSYVEIGVAFGKSLRIISHHFPELTIAGIDKINHGTHTKVPDSVQVVYGDSHEKWSEIGDKSLDNLFIDGDHTYKGCLSDFVFWFNKVKPGGRVIFHDYGRPTKEHEGVTQAVNAIKPLLEDFKSINYIACGTKPKN